MLHGTNQSYSQKINSIRASYSGTDVLNRWSEYLDAVQSVLLLWAADAGTDMGIGYTEPDMSIASLQDYIEAITGVNVAHLTGIS